MNLHRARYPILGGVFFTGAVSAAILWDHIYLPFRNPLQVVGYCTRIQLNPQNDLVRFLVFVFLPPALLAALSRLGGKGFRDVVFPPAPGSAPPTKTKTPVPGRRWWVALLLAAYAILLALNVPTYHAFGRFDSYHEGESLGTGICYLAGEKPYHDFFFFHGLVQDPLRSAWAFQLFGKSIAAERTFESLAKLLSWIFLAFFLDELFRKKASLAVVFLSLFALGYVSFSFMAFDTFFLPSLSPEAVVDEFQKHRSFWEMFNLLIITSRALATYLFLLVFLKLENLFSSGGAGGTVFWILTFLFSFIPWVALGYSVDRGFFVCLLYALLLPAFYLLYGRFQPWKGKWLLVSALGMGAALLLLEGLSRGQLWEGFKFIFLVVPSYKGLSETVPVPLFQWKFLFFFTLVAALVYRFAFLALAAQNASGGKSWISEFLKRNLVEGALLALVGFHFLTVLLRGDEEHLVYSLSVFYALVFYVLARLVGVISMALKPPFKRVCVGLALVISFFCLARDFRSDVLKANFPLGTPDEAFISQNDQAAIRLLRENMGPSDGFFTLTSEASWYYFLDKPCPTPFPYIWVAAPKPFQEQVVRDLAAKRVKWVLYRDDDWSDWIDGIHNDEKFPVVSQFVRDHYRPFKNIGGNEIWVLNQATPR